MRIVVERHKAGSPGTSTRANRHEPASGSPGSIDVQRAEMPQARPPTDLLALQRLIARKALPLNELPAPDDASRSALAPAQIHKAAKLGTSGTSGPLPYRDTIQRSFGKHDVAGIAAYNDEAAAIGAQAMRAEAFTAGNRVAFVGNPSLHTAAHEAAHAIQQRAGVQLKGGVGAVGDPYERHADAVADLVVQGRSAEVLLDKYAGTTTAPSVQRQTEHDERAVQAQVATSVPAAPAAPAAPANAPLQEFTATSYHNPQVAEGTVPVLNAQGQELGRVTGQGFVDAAMEGTAVLSNGTQVTVDRFAVPPDPAAYADAVAAARRRYFGTSRRRVPLSPQNVGLEIPNRDANRNINPATDTVSRVMVFRATGTPQGAGGALRPYRSIAAGGNIALGTRVHIQELQGRQLPDGTTHDGWVTVDDRGGNITGNRIDFYTGNDNQEFLGGTVHIRLQGAARAQGTPAAR